MLRLNPKPHKSTCLHLLPVGFFTILPSEASPQKNCPYALVHLNYNFIFPIAQAKTPRNRGVFTFFSPNYPSK